MRVVHAITKYPPASGGLELHVQSLARGARARGVDAWVVTTDLQRHRPPVARIAPEASAGDGVPVVRLVAEVVSTRDIRIPGLRESLADLRPDVLVAWDIWSTPFAIAVDLARERDIPLIANPIFHDRSDEWTKQLQGVAARIPPRAKVLFLTPWEEKRLAQLGCHFSDVDLHAPAVDLLEFDHPGSGPLPDVPRDRWLVTCVGRVTHSKGIDILLDAFARLPPRLADRLHLVVCGFIDSDERFEGQAASCGIADRCTFLYDLPRAQIVELLHASRLFALPSRAETFGIVVAEAWASRCLVVVSDQTALPYVVDHGRNGLVGSLDDFADALGQGLALLDTPEGEQMLAEGLRTVRSRYTRERQIDEMIRLVEEVVQRSER